MSEKEIITVGQPTIAAIATPPGVGGLSVIRISGSDAYSVAAKVFVPQNSAKKLENVVGYTAIFGSMQYNGRVLDEGIALCFRQPHSYTGENVVELSCHGGEAVSMAVLAACVAAGAQPAAAGEFTRRAVLNGRLSLAQAEAVMELISSQSRQGAALAKAALAGSLLTAVEEMEQKLVALAAHLAAYTDYPEEDVEELSVDLFLQVLNEVCESLTPLIEDYDRGNILRRGVQVAIVGSPNVGKSTLFNLLSGFQRAIVTPVAGTTRDVISESIVLDGIALNLADTAGIRNTGDEVEQEGIKRSYSEIEKAGLILAVFNGAQQLNSEDMQLMQLCADKPSVCIINKNDLGVQLNANIFKDYFCEIITVSALRPACIEDVKKAIMRVLHLENIDTEAASLINTRQLAAAETAKKALCDAKDAFIGGLGIDAAGVCLDDALKALAQLTGKDASEEVMTEVFSRFCVGK